MTQSTPGFVGGEYPTAAQWDSYFAAKLDVANVPAVGSALLGSTPVVGVLVPISIGANLSLIGGVLSASAGASTIVRVVTAAGNVTVLVSDGLLVINKTTGEATAVTLEANPIVGARHVIKDGKGDSLTNNITILSASGTIEGNANYVLNVNRESVDVIFNGYEWNVV